MTQAASPSAGARRLVELDALRGIAASLVMLFHYTTQYDRLFGHETAPSLALPLGHYGVNLFFMISGFVIFMTLHRISRPMDFVVSRFSRLFPAFWVAVALSFVLTHALDLPGKTVGLGTAAMNLFMIHGLVRIPHVDSVYWTLEIELIFYAGALLLYALGRLDKVHVVLVALLMLRLVYFLAERYAGIDLSWTLSHLLILPYIAWFICGIIIYRRITFAGDSPRKDAFVLTAAIVQLGIVEGPGVGLLAAALSALLLAAARGKLPFLAHPVLAWLGAISYTLYLLHENIGWGVIMQAQAAGIATDLSIALAIGLSLALASLLTRLVERPAMSWLRDRYRTSAVPAMANRRLLALAGTCMLGFAGLAYAWHRTKPAFPATSLDGLYRPSPQTGEPCHLTGEPRPLMVLALGQSNAGNHGQPVPASAAAAEATFFFKGKCYRSHGPAPGATGRGGNLWTVLSPRLAAAVGRPVVFSVLAVDASPVQHWVEPGPLNRRLGETLAGQKRHGFVPDIVLWQQGEADARSATTSHDYQESFARLVAMLREQGIAAPIVAALSTYCRNEGGDPIRTALIQSAARDPTVRIGPDTDTLTGAFRHDGCHFSASGLDAAAELWMSAIAVKK